MSLLVMETASCTYTIPPPPTNDGTVSRGNIGVLIDGAQIPQDRNDGWHHRDATLRTIQLVGSACEAARAGGTVTVVFRCLLP